MPINKCQRAGGCIPHEFQDKTHGQGKRVHTENNKGLSCTVCGNQITKGDGNSKKK